MINPVRKRLICTHNLPKRESVNILSLRFNKPPSHPSTVACRQFFDALQLCHANTWTKWTGGCNSIKRELNKCLHNEVFPLVRLPDLSPFDHSFPSSPSHAPQGIGRMQSYEMHEGRKRSENCTKMTSFHLLLTTPPTNALRNVVILLLQLLRYVRSAYSLPCNDHRKQTHFGLEFPL